MTVQESCEPSAPKRRVKLRDLPPVNPHQCYPVPVAGAYLGVGRDTAYKLVRSGVIRAIKLDDNVDLKVPGHEIIRLTSLPEAESA